MHDYDLQYISVKAKYFLTLFAVHTTIIHSLSVCTQRPLHTQTHMHTPKCRNMHLTVKKSTLHTHAHVHTHKVVESPWHKLPPISAASLLVQVAVSMTRRLRQNTCDPTVYFLAQLIDLLLVYLKKKSGKVKLNAHETHGLKLTPGVHITTTLGKGLQCVFNYSPLNLQNKNNKNKNNYFR